MEISGKIKVIGETQQVSESFKKRDLVITTSEQYPQHILIDFVQDKCDLLNNLRVGQEVKVGINLKGREWTSPQGETRYFNQIQGWRIEAMQQAPSHAPTESEVDKYHREKAAKKNATFQNQPKEEEHDDLPF